MTNRPLDPRADEHRRCVCGRDFLATRAWSTYCGPVCRKRAWRKARRDLRDLEDRERWAIEERFRGIPAMRDVHLRMLRERQAARRASSPMGSGK